MKARKRYTIIAVMFFSFAVLTPLMVFYVSGMRYDFKSHRIIKTGVISVKTSPKGANLLLNGKLTATTPADLRFVNPGDYSISIQKDGYFEWDKRLNVKSQYVTYLNQNLDNLILFKSNGPSTQIGANVLTMSAGNKRLLYLTRETLYLADTGNYQKRQQLSLPRPIDHAKVVASNDENYYLIAGSDTTSNPEVLFFDANNNKIFDLSTAPISPDTSEIQIINGKIYELFNKTLYLIDPANPTKVTLLSNIDGYSFSAAGLYYLSAGNLYHDSAPNINPIILVQNLPTFYHAQIFVSAQNQLFILGDGNLYAVGNGLTQLGSFVQDVSIDNLYRKMLFWTHNEIDVYDLSSSTLTLVTRTSEQIRNPQVFYGLGWIFYVSNGRMQTLELDSRDHQNNYTFKEVLDSAEFFATSDANSIILLDNGNLSELEIR